MRHHQPPALISTEGSCASAWPASVNYSGRLVVTNLAGTLAAGDSFKLFSSGSYSGMFTSISLPPLTGNLFWTNRLAIDGTVAVHSAASTTPTSITTSVSGNTLQLSWPADHTGWRLEVQTNNLVVGLSSNWFSIAGSSATNQFSLPIDPANASVFLRLTYP
jgi:hypothetical protein